VTHITTQLTAIVERVASAARAAGRSTDSVTIVAVSKQQSVAAIAAVHAAGIRHFGENYCQEALPKLERLAGLDIVWHFIGAIQTNKTRAIAEHFDWVHAVDRLKIAQRLAEQRPPHAPPLNVLIQVNQGDEAQKGGVPPGEVEALARQIRALPRLALRGLMTIPPHDADSAHYFAELAALRRNLETSGLPLDTLSMGMSADFETAIRAGATHVRIGTAIFGERAAREETR
jgi:pyridoxal phosphate enzyme (YggS family)